MSQADLAINTAITIGMLSAFFLIFWGLAELQHAIRIHWRFACARDRALYPATPDLEVVVSHDAVLRLLPTTIARDFAEATR